MARKKNDDDPLEQFGTMNELAAEMPIGAEPEVEIDVLEELAAQEDAAIAEAKVQPTAADSTALYCQSVYPCVVLGELGRFEMGVPRKLPTAIGDELVARKGFTRIDISVNA